MLQIPIAHSFVICVYLNANINATLFVYYCDNLKQALCCHYLLQCTISFNAKFVVRKTGYELNMDTRQTKPKH